MIDKVAKFVFYFLFFILVIFFAASVLAQESPLYDWQIKSFSSNIEVKNSRQIEITEKITTDFLVPKHGIYRTIPYRYYDNYGTGRSIFLKVISVTDENGDAYNYSRNYSSGNSTLKIGDSDKTVIGKKVYIIHYQIENALNYFDREAELYWNVNGNGWDVPIDEISTTLTLPDDGTVKNHKFFLGVSGSTGDSRVKINSEKPLSFSASGLIPKEGLSLVARWDENLTPKPGILRQLKWFLATNEIFLLPIIIVIILLVLLYKCGRDPKGRGTIAPEFSPPKELSVAEVGTIADESVNDRDLSATIIDFAVRGFIKIKEIEKKAVFAKKDYEIIKLKEYTGDNGNDKYLFDQLFENGKTFKISQAAKEGKLASTRKSYENKIYSSMIDKKFFSHSPKLIKGVYIGMGVMFIFLIFLAPALLERWFTITATAASLIISAILFFIFARFMPQRTKEGVLLKEKVEGFKLYLKTAERYRMKFYEKSGIFEKYLPYAIALGVADIWAKKFEGIYKNPPDWYDGHFAAFSVYSFSTSLSSEFSTSVNSAFAASTAASGSSGFSSGGGFSGGGFGGGGGGSW